MTIIPAIPKNTKVLLKGLVLLLRLLHVSPKRSGNVGKYAYSFMSIGVLFLPSPIDTLFTIEMQEGEPFQNKENTKSAMANNTRLNVREEVR